jgi:hypothetical protein
MIRRMIPIWAIIGIVALMFTSTVLAASASVTTSYPYTANDILTGVSNIYDFDIYDGGDTLVVWDGSNLKTYEVSSGDMIENLGAPTGYSGWASFVTIDPSEETVWIGFTVYGTNNDRIYQVDLDDAEWHHVASLSGNFDLDFYDGDAFVSGLNQVWSGGTSDTNCIWLLDTSGNNNHQKVIELDGNSAGLAIDPDSGDFYYASYNGDYARQLYRWDSDEVQTAIISPTTYLTYTHGTKLSDLEGGAYDVDVDEDGNVIFNGNGVSGSYNGSYLAVWDGTAGNGYRYDIIGTGSSGSSHWFTMIGTVGDITSGGTVYQGDYYTSGLAVVEHSP